jgi:membrane protein DedA with SNARE-associated domain
LLTLLSGHLVLAFSLHHIHIHIHIRARPVEYATLALGAFASAAGTPGPGEPLLIAAGILAAKHRLDLIDVLLVAFTASTAGGIVGWIAGLKAGRAVLAGPGPLRRLRLRALERGDEVFARWPALGVIVTPSWVAGIHHVRPGTYLLWNVVSSALWAGGIGLGAYFVGPPVVHFVDEVGWLTLLGAGVLVAAAVIIEVLRIRRRRGAASR